MDSGSYRLTVDRTPDLPIIRSLLGTRPTAQPSLLAFGGFTSTGFSSRQLRPTKGQVGGPESPHNCAIGLRRYFAGRKRPGRLLAEFAAPISVLGKTSARSAPGAGPSNFSRCSFRAGGLFLHHVRPLELASFGQWGRRELRGSDCHLLFRWTYNYRSSRRSSPDGRRLNFSTVQSIAKKERGRPFYAHGAENSEGHGSQKSAR
jgi:hypothetical protein